MHEQLWGRCACMILLCAWMVLTFNNSNSFMNCRRCDTIQNFVTLACTFKACTWMMWLVGLVLSHFGVWPVYILKFNDLIYCYFALWNHSVSSTAGCVDISGGHKFKKANNEPALGPFLSMAFPLSPYHTQDVSSEQCKHPGNNCAQMEWRELPHTK